MSKIDAIARFCRLAEQMSEEQLETVLDYSSYMLGPTVYSTLNDSQKASIDAGLADNAATRVVDGETAHELLRQRITNARR